MTRKRTPKTGRVRESALAPGATIAAGEFKAKCLELMDQVKERHVEFVITKHGKPVAKLVPVAEPRRDIWGYMRGTVTILGDIIEPVIDPDEITADEDNF